MPTFSIKTLGCKVNQYESQLIRENFIKNGFNEVNGKKAADIYVINTCTVTGHADRESRRLIRNVHRLNPNVRIVVTGCFIERDADAVSKIEGVTDIVKNCDKHKLPPFIIHKASPITQDFITDFKDHTKAFVKIQDGCNNFCSFCKVPLVRGHSKSRALEDIRKEITALLDSGFKEIVLSGICLGEWGQDLGSGFELTDVIEKLEDLNREFRIRLSSIELKHITDRLLNKISTSDKICRHLHIPLQSGDDSILKMMNRPYTSEEYYNIIMKIKSLIPKIGITTDVMVGFPGEDDNHFNATLALLRKCGIHRMHIFSYSKRGGTKAARLKNLVSTHTVKDRMNKLKRLSKELSYGYRKKFLKEEVEVLVESRRDRVTQLLTGYTDTYIKVLLDGSDSLKGTLLKCKLSKVTSDYTIARA